MSYSIFARTVRAVGRLFMRAEHLTDSEISGFIDRDLDFDQRSIVEEHLEGCRDCRLAIAEVSRLSRNYVPAVTQANESARELPARRTLHLPLLGAAVAASLVIVALSTINRSPPSASMERTAVESRADTRPVLRVVGPADNVAIDRDSLLFSWQAHGADSYRLTIFDETGSPVVMRETSDTLVRIDQTEMLPAGETYLWRVDAIVDGIAASSGVRKVRLSP